MKVTYMPQPSSTCMVRHMAIGATFTLAGGTKGVLMRVTPARKTGGGGADVVSVVALHSGVVGEWRGETMVDPLDAEVIVKGKVAA